MRKNAARAQIRAELRDLRILEEDHNNAKSSLDERKKRFEIENIKLITSEKDLREKRQSKASYLRMLAGEYRKEFGEHPHDDITSTHSYVLVIHDDEEAIKFLALNEHYDALEIKKTQAMNIFKEHIGLRGAPTDRTQVILKKLGFDRILSVVENWSARISK